MHTITAPALDSLWRDEVLNINFHVIGVDTLTQEALCVCLGAAREWNDAIHFTLFGTELKEIK